MPLSGRERDIYWLGQGHGPGDGLQIFVGSVRSAQTSTLLGRLACWEEGKWVDRRWPDPMLLMISKIRCDRRRTCPVFWLLAVFLEGSHPPSLVGRGRSSPRGM
jgi:hypothetical protein